METVDDTSTDTNATFMTRTFEHEFDPPNVSPVVGPHVELSVQEIEDAALREVLQTPGAALASWTILHRLLAPSPQFIFLEPLGQAREVKVALSALFGRFVARAYLERYFGLSVFSHVVPGSVVLDGRLPVKIKRLFPGDLPDWIACSSSLSDLTVAEAKGSHDKAGPAYCLARAWEQANRIEVFVQGQRAPLKRMAIATRWGMAKGGPREPRIAVYDPVDEGDPVGTAEQTAIFVGLFRHHVANMIVRLGHVELARSLRELATSHELDHRISVVERARGLVDGARTEELLLGDVFEASRILGGFVTRAGPLGAETIPRADRQVLSRLDLRPLFVGIDRELVRAVINGDPSNIQEAIANPPAVPRTARSDHAGGWIIPFDDEEVIGMRE